MLPVLLNHVLRVIFTSLQRKVRFRPSQQGFPSPGKLSRGQGTLVPCPVFRLFLLVLFLCWMSTRGYEEVWKGTGTGGELDEENPLGILCTGTGNLPRDYWLLGASFESGRLRSSFKSYGHNIDTEGVT